MRWFVFILALLLPLGAMAQEEDEALHQGYLY